MDPKLIIPGHKYWGFLCTECNSPIPITPYEDGYSEWRGESFTLPCQRCQFEGSYLLSDIQVLQATREWADNDPEGS